MASEGEEVKGELGGVGNKRSAEKKEVVISECPVQAVVVYPDRAEVRGVQYFVCGKN